MRRSAAIIALAVLFGECGITAVADPAPAVARTDPAQPTLAQTTLAQSAPSSGRPPPARRPSERPSARGPQPDRAAEIRARGEVLICTSRDLMGLAWRNPRSGELEGLDTDIGRALATRLEVRARFLEWPSDGLLGALEEGRCDVAMGGIGVTAARAERVAFTKPYLAGPLTLVTLPASRRVRNWGEVDRGGMVVAVGIGSVAEEALRDGLRHADLLVVRNPMTVEGEVLSGRADAMVSDYAASRHLRNDPSWLVAEAPREAGETLYAYAVTRGDPTWLTEVNAFLAGAKSDGTVSRSAARWGLSGMVVQ